MSTTTVWDKIQQVIRIAMYFISGFAVERGIGSEELWLQITGGIVAIGAAAWTILWNRNNVATTAGMQQAGLAGSAAAVANAKESTK